MRALGTTLIAGLCIALLAPLAARSDELQAVRVAAISYAEVHDGFWIPPIVEPVVIVNGYALADWVAGPKQGQVVLVQRPNGRWKVLDLENAVIADAGFLSERYGIPPATAKGLVAELRAAERRESGQ